MIFILVLSNWLFLAIFSSAVTKYEFRPQSTSYSPQRPWTPSSTTSPISTSATLSTETSIALRTLKLSWGTVSLSLLLLLTTSNRSQETVILTFHNTINDENGKWGIGNVSFALDTKLKLMLGPWGSPKLENLKYFFSGVQCCKAWNLSFEQNDSLQWSKDRKSVGCISTQMGFRNMAKEAY